MADDTDDEDTGGIHSFWSGTIAFGLVSLPVNLYTANRSSRVSLRMLDRDGTPLARRYFCSREEVPLLPDDLVRGYEIEREKFIEISDEELEALVPPKSREIDLRRFVPVHAIDPMYFERAYFLVPEEGAVKAYRLLAETMESVSRAGIATVVMRGKEYLVAIIAEQGVLRAETLRFHDELRTPEDVGLPKLAKASAAEIKAISQAMRKLSIDELDREELTDDTSRRLLELVEHKLEAGEDVLHAPDVPEPESAQIIDLMQVLKQSLQAKGEAAPIDKHASHTEPKKTRRGKKTSPSAKAADRTGHEDLDPDMSKSALYERAKTLGIAGRSQMSKDELMRAIRQSG